MRLQQPQLPYGVKLYEAKVALATPGLLIEQLSAQLALAAAQAQYGGQLITSKVESPDDKILLHVKDETVAVSIDTIVNQEVEQAILLGTHEDPAEGRRYFLAAQSLLPAFGYTGGLQMQRHTVVITDGTEREDLYPRWALGAFLLAS